MGKDERRILIITCFGHAVCHFNMLAFTAVVLPLTVRMGLDMSQVLDLSVWMYLLFGLTSLPWGMAADRWGPQRVLAVFFTGAGVCGLAGAYFVDSPQLFGLALTGIGLFSGIYHPAGVGLISTGVKRVSLGMGYNGMAGSMGLAAAPILTGLVNWLWGVRAAYVMVGLINLAGLLLMILIPLPGGDRVRKEASPQSRKNGLWIPFVILLAAVMLEGFAYRGATVIIPSLFELKGQALFNMLGLEGKLSPNLLATGFASTIYLFSIGAQYLGGRAGERFDPVRAYLFFQGAGMLAAMLSWWVAGASLALCVMIYLFFMVGGQPLENTLVGKYTPQSMRSTAFGIKMMFTFGLGALAVKMVSHVQSLWGLEAVFPSLSLVSLSMVAMIVLLLLVTRRKGAQVNS